MLGSVDSCGAATSLSGISVVMVVGGQPNVDERCRHMVVVLALVNVSGGIRVNIQVGG